MTAVAVVASLRGHCPVCKDRPLALVAIRYRSVAVSEPIPLRYCPHCGGPDGLPPGRAGVPLAYLPTYTDRRSA